MDIALKSDGTMSWGVPRVLPAGDPDIAAVARGASHGIALKSNGTVIGWTARCGQRRAIDAACRTCRSHLDRSGS